VAQLQRRGIAPPRHAVARVRCSRTLPTRRRARGLARDVLADVHPTEDLAAHVTDAVKPGLQTLRDKLGRVDGPSAIARRSRKPSPRHAIKMPQLAHARCWCAVVHRTPSIDAVLELFSRETVAARLRSA
jgi:glutamyl-tRNA synthetase